MSPYDADPAVFESAVTFLTDRGMSREDAIAKVEADIAAATVELVEDDMASPDA